jgi:alpha-glucosidase (family GH31 glycosyl hydrolase)
VLTDSTTRNFHIPDGDWYDVGHSCVVHGTTELTNVPVTLADIPMFVKLGTSDTGRLLQELAHNPNAAAGAPTCG